MTKAPPRTVVVARQEAPAYLAKGREYAVGARRALEELRLHGAGLEAIHAVISSCDALTIARLELRSRGEDHRDVLQLITRIKDSGISDLQRQVSQVLSVKNLVEYGGEGLLLPQTQSLVLQAERVVRWISDHVDR
jgi:hypothetical protein